LAAGFFAVVADGKENEDIQRNQSCPMQYLDKKGRRLFILYGEMTGSGRFCKDPPDECWKQLNVKG
jgi:hypothetical protein